MLKQRSIIKYLMKEKLTNKEIQKKIKDHFKRNIYKFSTMCFLISKIMCSWIDLMDVAPFKRRLFRQINWKFFKYATKYHVFAYFMQWSLEISSITIARHLFNLSFSNLSLYWAYIFIVRSKKSKKMIFKWKVWKYCKYFKNKILKVS